jgi:hypothetical protein
VAAPEASLVAVDPVVAASEASLEAVDLEVAGPEAFFEADVAGPQASFDTVLLFDVSVPAFAVGAEVDSPVLPSVFGFPNVDYPASSSNSAEVVG